MFIPIDKQADFMGGNRALQKFIIENLQFPIIEDLDNRISSVRVMADFDGKGTLSNYEFRTDIGLTGVYNYEDIQELENKYSKFYEEKVKELLEKMPKWQPAQADNQNIKSRTSLPVVFRYAE